MLVFHAATCLRWDAIAGDGLGLEMTSAICVGGAGGVVDD